ncbi:hypothetical protein BJ684DRAFT_14535 [Piptocephalis cylindrospora]|uniref:Uncharacterized protein n=1 Tax=Piptocephalis cylindrospora TaxID=1907219 RepID=A0A4P9Y8R8_9FUNG|nr:hypothetical protein BJ684DRAFT_14535 [Piptocephalis cylindrospora]|eukprot:RKP15192.1 hypothetical protein BJ684DRAFT_14535 [Piptocephalis cylindrospora]
MQRPSFLPLLLLAFLVSLHSTSEASGLVRRAAGCLNDIYCSPRANETWLQDGTSHQATWNTERPAFVAAGRLVIYLTEFDNPTSHVDLFNVNNNIGYVSITPKDLYFGGPNSNTNWKSKAFRLYIGIEGESGFAGPYGPRRKERRVIQLIIPSYSVEAGINGSLPVLATAVVTTEVGEATGTPKDDPKEKDDSGGLSTAAAVIIGVAAFLVLAATLALLLVWRARRKRNGAAMGKPGGTDHSKATLIGGASGKMIDGDEKGREGVSGEEDRMGNLARNSGSSTMSPSPPPTGGEASSTGGAGHLSQNDAMLIAATYRQLMRKPSWKVEDDEDWVGSGPPGSTTESTEPVNGDEEERRRREVSERLMREELAQDGHGLQEVRAGNVVHVPDSSK